MTPLDPEEKIFSLGDILRLFQSQRRKILRSALLFGLLSCLWALSRGAQYKAEATFKESAEKKSSESVLSAFAAMGTQLEAPQAAMFMKSYQVLKPLVQELGIQIQPVNGGRFSRLWKKCMEGVRNECAGVLPDVEVCRFADVFFEGDAREPLQIKWLEGDRFEAAFQGRSCIAHLGEKVDLQGLSFRFTHKPAAVRDGSILRCHVIPWDEAATALRSKISIVSNKQSKTVFELSFMHRDRFFAAHVLNRLMGHYQLYLKQEHNQLAKEQLSYLEQRQAQMDSKLDLVYQEHVDMFSEELKEKGFFNFEQEQAFAIGLHRNLNQELFELEMERDQLAAPHTMAGLNMGGLASRVQELQAAILSLENERNLIDASLYSRQQGRDKPSFWKELCSVRSDLAKASSALEELNRSPFLPQDLELFCDPSHIVKDWAAHIQEKRVDRQDLIAYVGHLVQVLSLREKILAEREVHSRQVDLSLEGMDRQTARQLILDAHRKLEEIAASRKQSNYYLERLEQPSFEFSSLVSVLGDPGSQRLLREAADLYMAMQDAQHHSDRERERHQKEYDFLRKALGEHLKQLSEVNLLHEELQREKIHSLQQIALESIDQDISANKSRIEELLRHRKEEVAKQIAFLDRKLYQLRDQVAYLPEHWKREELLKGKLSLGAKMMETLVELVESKTIGHHMHHVESKPLDIAIVPKMPRKQKAIPLTLAGALLGGLGSLFLLFLKNLYRGFPATAGTLKALRYPFGGSISFHADGPGIHHLESSDLETLRKVLFAIQGSKVIALAANAGPDYSHTLAELLAREGRSVLLIRCDFHSKFSEKDTPGLLQALQGEADPFLRSCGSYAVLGSGGHTRFGTELLCSQAMKSLLKQLSLRYDHLLLFNKAPLDHSENRALLAYADSAIATIVLESIESLTPLVQWGYYEGNHRLTFLISCCSV